MARGAFLFSGRCGIQVRVDPYPLGTKELESPLWKEIVSVRYVHLLASFMRRLVVPETRTLPFDPSEACKAHPDCKSLYPLV